MVTQTIRRTLVLLSSLVLAVGLAPPPASAGPAGAGLTGGGLAAGTTPAGAPDSAAAPATQAAPAGQPAAPQAVPDLPAGELRDVYSGLLAGIDSTAVPAVPGGGAAARPAGVAEEVRAAATADGTVPVIIRLRAQADLARVEQAAGQAGQAAAASTIQQLRGAPHAAQAARQAARAARGQVVVDALRTAAEGAGQDQVQTLLEQHDADRVRDFWIFNGLAATVDATTLEALADHPAVASVTLDQTITVAEPIPAEIGEPLLPSWSLERVNAPDVWGEYGVRGAGVVVGVMDTGVDGDHPALADSWRGNTGDPAASWFAATGENYLEPGDGHGHGTHVTGSIVGTPPGEVTGVAPEAQWIAAKIFRDSGTTTTSIIHDAFEWMLAPGGDPANAPDVVNNSWGSNASNDTEFWDDVAAWEAAGIVPVFSNGNAGPGTGTVGSPASFPHAIGVGATDEADRIAWFSSRGPAVWDGVEQQKPQLSAPGYLIRSTWPTDLIPAGYNTISGTSMAAPHVTGVVALMLSAAPGRPVSEIRQALVESARAESHMAALPDAYGAGVADAFAAVTYLTRTGLVTGTVTGPDSAPVPATVAAAGVTTTADPDTGRYALRLPPGTHQLTVHHYGFQPRSQTVLVAVGGTVALDLPLAAAALHTLTGRVTGPAGDPVPGARVAVAGTPVPSAHSDQDGRFRLAVAAGSYDLRVTAGGHAPAVVPLALTGDTDLTVPLAALAGPAQPGWAQYQNNPARTGLSLEGLAGETLRPDWTAEAGGEVLFSAPVIGAGRVFVNTDDGRLVAFDLDDGTRRWEFTGSVGMRGAPAVAGGLVYTGGGVDGGIHAVDAATGAPVWSVPTPGRRTIYTAPVVVDGIVYANTGFTTDQSDTVYALDAQTGAELWSVDIGPRAFFGVAVAGGIVAAASAGARTLVGLDAATGERRWSLEREVDEFVAAPSIADGTVYVTTSVPSTGGFAPGFQGSLLAVDAATGALRWETEAHGDGQGTAPAVHGDLVIAGSHGLGMVAAYHRDTGAPAWHYGLARSGGVSSSVMVSGDGYVVGGAQVDRRLFVLDAASGEQVWEWPLDADLLSSPAYAGGTLVIADDTGTVRAFHPTGQVRGTVTGPDGPLAASVRAVGTGAETTADPDTGEFELAGLAPGGYAIEISQFGFGSQTRTVQVLAGQTATVDVELAPVGDGTVAGTVRDEAGQPLAGATVSISPTPIAPVVTGADGGFEFDPVAAGSYRLAVVAAGYADVAQEIVVVAGETTTREVTLQRFDIAVVSDHLGMITDLLAGAGWRVDRVSFDEIVGTTGQYRAVVLAGMSDDRADADLDRFAQIVAEADQTGTSLVVLDQWAFSYGSLRSMSLATGDPAVVEQSAEHRGGVWLEEVVPHPVTASLPATGRVPLLSSNIDQLWFDGYSGYSLARLGTDETGQLGDGIGYQPRTLVSNHILLPVHAPTPWSNPAAGWLPVMTELLTDAVSYAAGASYGEVAGQVTDQAGDPVAATVEVIDRFEHTTAGADGEYRLLLEPGDYTLRFRFLGAQTIELPVTITDGQTRSLDVTLPAPDLGVVSGVVTDADRGTPVAGATVTLAGSERPAVNTGPDGRYLIEEVPAGTYQLEITAGGYQPFVAAGVAVVEGELTTVDAALTRAPGVVVLGDRNSEITEFLEQHSIPAEEAGWEVLDALDEVEVVILQNPPALDRDAFRAALAAFDAAGVSVIFPADGWSTRTRGFDMLVQHTGSPSDYDRLGGFNGPEIFLHNLADHPLFDGIEGDPVQLLTTSSEAAVFPDYAGVTLAQVAEAGTEPTGFGMAYDARTPDSVHVILAGLAATLRNTPSGSWTPDGQQIFLNAVRWAAAPGLGGLTGAVTDRNEEPIPSATVELLGTNWRAVTGENGGFEIGVPPGDYTVRYTAFGYLPVERAVTVGPDQVLDISVQLEVGEVGAITGVVTSGGDGGGVELTAAGDPLAGVEVTLHGTPYRTVTDQAGGFQFTRVEPGDYELELETGGHVRTLAAVSVTAGQNTVRDVAVPVSPLVGIVDDSDFTNSRDRGKEFLLDWGYRVEDIGFESLDRIPALDLVVANVSDFNLDPGAEALQAFDEAVNRAAVPVLWMAQHGRGAIQFLNAYHGDPAVVGEGFNDGTVTATVLPDQAGHPLVAGLPEQFELIEPNDRYTFFDEFGGTTVATLATGDGGEQGATIAYRGRTTGTVDVLLSTLSVTTWGAPSTRQSPAVNWTPAAERVFVNALAWALDAQGLGAEVRGTVLSSRGGTLPSEVEVVETGRTYQGRAGDGSFLVPLRPGSWTLRVSTFGHEPATAPVTVAAGEVVELPLTLTAVPTGAISGTVTGPDGSPVAGASVTLPGTPLGATTGADGGYTVELVPGGDWTVRVTAAGFRAAEVPTTVVTGQATQVDVRLKLTARVAITDTTGASSFGTALRTMLETEGYQVELFSRSATGMAELMSRMDEFDLVIFNPGALTTGREAFAAAVDAAAAAGVSAIFGSQFGGEAIGELSRFRGDPSVVDWGFVPPGIDYLPTAAHPIFAGFPVGEPIELITSNLSNNNQQWSSFDGWSGQTIGRVQARADGTDFGGGVGYRFSSPTSVEVLLGSLTANTHGMPGNRWTDNAEQIYLNAVGWAVDATQAEVTGVVTGAGAPLAGARVVAVDAGASTTTGPDGSYALGLAQGTHSIQVTAFGFAPATHTVEVPAAGGVTLDVDLVPLPRGSVSGTVTSVTGEPVAGASVSGSGPLEWTATTDEAGRWTADNLLEGEYQVTITADGFLPATAMVTVTADLPVTLDVSLQPTDVGVLGDADGALTAYLRSVGVPAAELAWDGGLDLTGYQVVVVNGGSPDQATFEAVLAAADTAQTSLVFTGTWAVDRGGIRLLERYTDRVTVGTQGYGDGPVQLTGFDPAHPVFTGLGGDPATLIVTGGYYSVLDSYLGQPLADLHVTRAGDDPVTGLAAGWDWRTAGSVEVLLSASAVTEAVGPGLGWTPAAGQLVVDTIAWARDRVLAPPSAPTLQVGAPVVLTETVAVSGLADWPSRITVRRDGQPVTTVDTGLDGSWSAEVPLLIGDNQLTALATNLAGGSPVSAPVTVSRWVEQWQVRGEWPVHAVTLALAGPSPWTDPAEKADLVVLDAGGNEVRREELSWVHGFYLVVLRGLAPGDYTLRAELMVDGHLVVIDGPELS
jgi:outer membrane protein assembly factor BamB/subtilisin family serine protease